MLSIRLERTNTDYAVRVNSIFSEEDVMRKESWGNGTDHC